MRTRTAPALAALVLAVVAASCGSGREPRAVGDPVSRPVFGGKVVYGLEAETTGGWCLPEAQLAISGIQVARAVYDTLTVPDSNGDAKPFLARSITPNETFTEWTIELRPGITFHDGSALDATVVKNNLDALRGEYPNRYSVLGVFIFEDVSATEVVDPMTVKVTTATPWPSFPAYLYGSGRYGMVAQAQLDDPDTCDSNLIGTGPFRLQEWRQNDRLVVTRNPDYWQTDDDGVQLPYLDEIEFRPIIEPDARTNALLAGDLQALHTSTSEQIDILREEQERGEVALVESEQFPEVSYILLNTARAPFDHKSARLALAHALDREAYVEVRELGLTTVASGPFGPGEVGYLPDAGFPEYDPDQAREHVAAYQEETGKPLEFDFALTPDPDVVKSAQLLQEQLASVGIKMILQTVEQTALINLALGDDWQSAFWRNHPGGNPDDQYIWWHGGSPVNFGKFTDPQIDQLLEAGRAEPDKITATGIYQDINRRFGSEAYNIWLDWTPWDIASSPILHGVMGPDLPDGGGAPFPGLATGHPVSGIWLER